MHSVLNHAAKLKELHLKSTGIFLKSNPVVG